MGKGPQDIRYQFLNSIMKENKVSLKSVYKCAEENKIEIESIGQIFDTDNEISVRKRFVLLSLLSRDLVKENVEYYREVKNTGTELLDSDIDQYKVLIITALMFNTLFYVSSCNWYGLIRREVNRMSIRSRFKVIKGGLSERESFDRIGRSESEFVALAAKKENILDIGLFTTEQIQSLKVSSALLNPNKKYIRIAFQTETNPIDSHNLVIEISKGWVTQSFPLAKGNIHFKGKEWIVTLDVSDWQETLLGSMIKCVEK